MFACCVMRSGTIPQELRSDRGPELKNALMAEYSALVGLSHRFNTPWRPMETGLVENKHKDTQKIMGMLVKDNTGGREPPKKDDGWITARQCGPGRDYPPKFPDLQIKTVLAKSTLLKQSTTIVKGTTNSLNPLTAAPSRKHS